MKKLLFWANATGSLCRMLLNTAIFMDQNFQCCINKTKYGNKVDTAMDITTVTHNFDFETPSLFLLNETLRVHLLDTTYRFSEIFDKETLFLWNIF